MTGEKDSLVEMFKLNMIQRMNQDAAAEKIREAERKSEREREERRYAIEMAKCEQEKQRHEQMMAQINGQNANFQNMMMMMMMQHGMSPPPQQPQPHQPPQPHHQLLQNTETYETNQGTNISDETVEETQYS